MDGVARAAGIGQMVEFGGRSWSVRGRTVEYYALLEAEIIGLRGNPFDVLVDCALKLKSDPAALDLLARTVAERFRNWRFATYADHNQFSSTPRGDAFRIWTAIKHQDPALTLDQVLFWLMEMYARDGKEGIDKREKIFDAIDQASGDDSLGNSTGRRETIPTPAA